MRFIFFSEKNQGTDENINYLIPELKKQKNTDFLRIEKKKYFVISKYLCVWSIHVKS